MSINISGIGLQVLVKATNTFPLGIAISQFADDSDPLDAPSMQVGDVAMGLNGDLITWGKATPIVATFNIIPGSVDDINLSTLFEANRTARNKKSAQDVIDIVMTYPDGSVTLLTDGVITDGMPFDGVQSAMRKKTKTYTFKFENKISA